jgi:hypothetical protein
MARVYSYTHYLYVFPGNYLYPVLLVDADAGAAHL